MTRKAIAFTVLFLLLPLLVGIDLCHGGADISLADVLAALTGGEVPRTTAVIVRDIRLVKAIVAVLSGAALAYVQACRCRPCSVIRLPGHMFLESVRERVWVWRFSFSVLLCSAPRPARSE